MKNNEIIITADGSNSILVSDLKETYHSKFGAITESQHIFINTGLKSLPDSFRLVKILEVGFGTGLNALLTYIESKNAKKQIHYTGIELYPIATALANSLNYPEKLDIPVNDFIALHSAKWEEEERLSDHFTLLKLKRDLEVYIPEKEKFNLVYFDAFGPEIQPLLWTEFIFAKLADSLESGGILVTYSTKGDVKRALKKTGFTIQKFPGPPGKREILKAIRQ